MTQSTLSMDENSRKERMVSFRLSRSEYEKAEALCRAYGFRSMSLLARSRFLGVLQAGEKELALGPDVAAIRERVHSIAEDLDRLLAIVDLGPKESH
jgi:hypothetical protein